MCFESLSMIVMYVDSAILLYEEDGMKFVYNRNNKNVNRIERVTWDKALYTIHIVHKGTFSIWT